MVLYKKIFPLGKDISFFQYITALRKAYFPNFVLTIDKMPPTENYQVLIFFTASLWRWGLASSFFHDGVFLRKCVIQYFKDEGHVIFQASPTTRNLFIALFYVISAILFSVFVIFSIATNNSLSLNDIFGFVIVTIVMLAPLTLIYLRDKKLLDKIGSLGAELEKSN